MKLNLLYLAKVVSDVKVRKVTRHSHLSHSNYIGNLSIMFVYISVRRWFGSNDYDCQARKYQL